MEDMFPSSEGTIPLNIKITEEGKYSFTKRKDGERILRHIESIVSSLSETNITDATACIGSDTIHFGLHCKHVTSIEYKKENYDALVHNINQYKLENIVPLWGDCVELFNWQTDVLYVDPPWGGPNYKEFNKLDLYLSDIRLDKWIEDILHRKNRPKYIFLKLPSNYNFSNLAFLPNIDKTHKFIIRRFVLYAFTVNQDKSQ